MANIKDFLFFFYTALNDSAITWHSLTSEQHVFWRQQGRQKTVNLVKERRYRFLTQTNDLKYVTQLRAAFHFYCTAGSFSFFKPTRWLIFQFFFFLALNESNPKSDFSLFFALTHILNAIVSVNDKSVICFSHLYVCGSSRFLEKMVWKPQRVVAAPIWNNLTLTTLCNTQTNKQNMRALLMRW